MLSTSVTAAYAATQVKLQNPTNDCGYLEVNYAVKMDVVIRLLMAPSIAALIQRRLSKIKSLYHWLLTVQATYIVLHMMHNRF